MKPYFQRGIALGALLALAVGGGCKVGSDYQQPNVSAQVNRSYSEVKEEAKIRAVTGEDVTSWWSQINDATLVELTQEAVSGSLTLQEALFRIQSARAALGSTSSNLLPQVAQDGGYAYQSRAGRGQDVFSTATSMSWELDVFGRIQRSIEAANADMEVQRWLYRDAYVILVADVAQAYVDARSYQDQIRSAKISILVQQSVVDYVKNNEAAGTMSQLDIYRALGPMHNTEATLSMLETQYQQTVNRLCILLGRTTGDGYVASRLLDDRALPTKEELSALMNSGQEADRDQFVAIMRNLLLEDLRIPEPPKELLVGIPADLLRRRPDVRAAEQRIVAQNARVGVAVADLYPMFTLSGSFGLEANSFSNMFDSDAIAAGVGPGFRWNILNFGKYRFNIEAQRFMQEELIASYRQKVLEAAEDVDNALVLYANESERNQQLHKAVDAYIGALEKTLVIKSAGAGDIQPILEAAAGLVSNGLQFVQSKGNQTGAVVRLYRALGGDWDTQSTAPVAQAAPVVSNYDPREDWERRQAQNESSVAEALAAAQARKEQVVVKNAEFEIAADDASPELASPIIATTEAPYAEGPIYSLE